MRHFRIILLSAIFLALITLPSQSRADVIVAKDTVTGTVIGRDKQPVPGAKVEIVGQPYSTYTDLDGRFNIKCDQGARKVLVSYPKARDIKKKITPDMTVRIGRTWRDAPESYQWFAGAGIGIGLTNANVDIFSYDDHHHLFSRDAIYIAPNISVMAGRLKKVGWYAKYMLACPVYDHDYGYTKAHTMAAILGGMVRLGCPLHFYLGGGFGYTYLHQTTQYLYPHFSWQIDYGLLFRIKDNYGISLSMNAGCTKEAEITYISGWNFGFVYFFNK